MIVCIFLPTIFPYLIRPWPRWEFWPRALFLRGQWKRLLSSLVVGNFLEMSEWDQSSKFSPLIWEWTYGEAALLPLETNTTVKSCSTMTLYTIEALWRIKHPFLLHISKPLEQKTPLQRSDVARENMFVIVKWFNRFWWNWRARDQLIKEWVWVVVGAENWVTDYFRMTLEARNSRTDDWCWSIIYLWGKFLYLRERERARDWANGKKKDGRNAEVQQWRWRGWILTSMSSVEKGSEQPVTYMIMGMRFHPWRKMRAQQMMAWTLASQSRCWHGQRCSWSTAKFGVG